MNTVWEVTKERPRIFCFTGRTEVSVMDEIATLLDENPEFLYISSKITNAEDEGFYGMLTVTEYPV